MSKILEDQNILDPSSQTMKICWAGFAPICSNLPKAFLTPSHCLLAYPIRIWVWNPCFGWTFLLFDMGTGIRMIPRASMLYPLCCPLTHTFQSDLAGLSKYIIHFSLCDSNSNTCFLWERENTTHIVSQLGFVAGFPHVPGSSDQDSFVTSRREAPSLSQLR